jgi:hypothetical protein
VGVSLLKCGAAVLKAQKKTFESANLKALALLTIFKALA